MLSAAPSATNSEKQRNNLWHRASQCPAPHAFTGNTANKKTERLGYRHSVSHAPAGLLSDQMFQTRGRKILAQFFYFICNFGLHRRIIAVLDNRIDPLADLLHLRFSEAA